MFMKNINCVSNYANNLIVLNLLHSHNENVTKLTVLYKYI